MARRWIRIDVGWSDSEWVGGLEPAGRLAWVELMTYAKRDGVGGVVKALTPVAFGRKVRIPVEDVSAMLEAAIEDGALKSVDGNWILANWSSYQDSDSTAKERMRRYRAEKSALTPLRRNDRNEPSRPVTGGVTRRVTETETETETKQIKETVSNETDGEPSKVEEPEAKERSLAEIAEERFQRCRSELAPAIRLHAWLDSTDPPKSPDNKPWHMGRELTIAKELLKQFTPEELLGGIECYRETHPNVPEQLKWSLSWVYSRGDRWRMVRAVATWREKQIDAPGMPSFTPMLSIHAA